MLGAVILVVTVVAAAAVAVVAAVAAAVAANHTLNLKSLVRSCLIVYTGHALQ